MKNERNWRRFWLAVILTSAVISFLGCAKEYNHIIYATTRLYIETAPERIAPDSLTKVLIWIKDTTKTDWYYIQRDDGSISDSLSNEWIIETTALRSPAGVFYDFQMQFIDGEILNYFEK